MRYCLRNAEVFQGGVFHSADVFVSDGKIVAMGERLACPGDAVSIDLRHMALFPGFVDVHVHLREPGFSDKETIRTGTLAAAHGGFAHVACMPNLDPVPDTLEHLQPQLDAIARSAVCHVHPYGAITMGEQGKQLAVLSELAPYVLAFSDDGRGVQDRAMMREAMRRAKDLGKLIAAHCEDNSLLHGGYIHNGAYAKAHGHKGICSESEWGPIARDLELAGSLNGIVGLETAFPILYTALVRPGILPLAQLVALLTDKPRQRFGLAQNPLDWTVFDLSQAWTVDPEDLCSQGRSTPFAGWTVYGKCLRTTVGGRAAWEDPAWQQQSSTQAHQDHKEEAPE